ncbi:NUDIX domain-containing protein [Candidatus Gottesmanbacteria bacterium]|nr:NUDIX domain-containing protein [Candidatus Gottesmanbacteria bacterium]
MRRKKEISSGGIVYKLVDSSPHILVLKDSKGKWTFPKGLIEENEDPVVCAKREIKEEVGVTEIEFVKELGTVHYKYIFENDLIDKTVFYSLFRLIGSPVLKPQKEEGIQQVMFIDLKGARNIIGYEKTNAPILSKIEDFFQKKDNKAKTEKK